MPSRRFQFLALLSWVTLCFSTSAFAEPTLRQPVPDSHALSGVRVVTAPGEVIDDATIVIRRGVIEAVGRGISIPADARVHEFPREPDQPPITVYPGLIEPFFKISVAEPDHDGTPLGATN